MYLQHAPDPTVHKFRYFTPDTKFQNTVLNHDAVSDSGTARSEASKKDVKSFLEPDETTFAKIRHRLSTLSLSTEYSKGLEPSFISPPFQRDKKVPPRRISSISSKDTHERHERSFDGTMLTKPRIHSRTSFHSDDKEIRRTRKSVNMPRNRASETNALNKLNENILTPGQNPELFSRQIRIKDNTERSSGKGGSSRCSSPKSVKSIDSSGKIHLGLIESLDLNEKLNDLEKIKERYSNNTFMNSLTLYKLRGHDRCLKHNGSSDHIPRGTRLQSPEPTRTASKYSSEGLNAINGVISPRLADKLLPHLNQTKNWEPDKSHLNNQIEAHEKVQKRSGRKTPLKRKKSVGFVMEPKELIPNETEDNPTAIKLDGTGKEIKSILKRTNSQSIDIDVNKLNEKNYDDEFVVNESYLWKYHLPKINSPVHNQRGKSPMSFRRKMYHFGDGVSDEFEQVISKYGNCRQGSWIRDQTYVRDQSFTSQV